MIQSVVIAFDDGTTATFTGPAVCFEGEKRKISDIHFTEPKPLPADCSWGWATRVQTGKDGRASRSWRLTSNAGAAASKWITREGGAI